MAARKESNSFASTPFVVLTKILDFVHPHDATALGMTWPLYKWYITEPVEVGQIYQMC